VIDAADIAGDWDALRRLWPEGAEEDVRYGPRSWRWSGNEIADAVIRVSDRWQQELIRVINPRADSPRGLGVAPPTAGVPMNYIAPGAAVRIASLVGARLPTPGEWTAAAAAAGAPADTAPANLRDTTWKEQQSYVAGLLRQHPEAIVHWPDAGIFRPASVSSSREGGATSRPTQDGTVWFAPADAAASTEIVNLVGNVAEYVIDAPPPSFTAAPTGGKAGAEAAREYVREHGAKVFVIGGSALSPPEASLQTPYPLVEPDEGASGYSDVGFRLAFSATGAPPLIEPLFGALARAAADAAYIRP